jgi:hypothetical protein
MARGRSIAKSAGERIEGFDRVAETAIDRLAKGQWRQKVQPDRGNACK